MALVSIIAVVSYRILSTLSLSPVDKTAKVELAFELVAD